MNVNVGNIFILLNIKLIINLINYQVGLFDLRMEYWKKKVTNKL